MVSSKELQNFFKEYLSKNPPKLESNQKKLSYITKEEIILEKSIRENG